ncbi:MAG TPA: radical SAM protein [Syntrophobacteria bacterium]|nr:radical SAM protein [Syntrophobacteria bacterium]
MIEQGPIRPPSEARSLLLRLTRNCPWNQCLFCPVYKGQEFSRRSVAEIKEEIDLLGGIVEEIQRLSWRAGCGGKVTSVVLSHLLAERTSTLMHRQVAHWLYFDEGSVFLQDANSLIMEPEELADVLRYLRSRVPGIRRITSYARSRTLARRSLQDLVLLREAGLDRIHIGLESGYDPLLRFMRKGVTAADHVKAGCLVRDAGISLSEYVMPGLGGKAWWREHALATAAVLNEINPDFIRLRSLRVPRSTPLRDKMEAGEFEPLDDDDVVREIRLFVETLEGITSTVTSDHIMNLLEEITGTLPDDKEAMLAVADSYLALSDADRLIFKVGRWGGAFRALSDLENPGLKRKIQDVVAEWEKEAPGAVARTLREMADQYI